MKVSYIAFGVLLCFSAEFTYAKKRYDGYKLLSVVASTENQLTFLQSLTEKFDFWLEPRCINLAAELSVSPVDCEKLFEQLNRNNILVNIVEDNIQTILDEYDQSSNSRLLKALEWTDYHTLAEIGDWLDQVAANNSNVETIVAGQTYEGRQIRGINITNGDNLPGVIIEAGIHAREWIGPAATSWIINEIINSPANSLWRKFNYLYIPNLNPDGYEYSWTEDRMWRKTRRPYGDCYGADPNRNFDNHWMEAGASRDPCSETYGGPSAFSEIESKSFSDYLRKVGKDYDLYIAFHSAAQLIIFPWGWTPNPAPLHDLWQRIGDAAARDIAAVNGTKFTVGDIYTTIYPASATSMDWYYGEFNSTLSYTYEMRSGYGFVLPPQFIIPSAKEHLAGLQTMLEEYLKLST